MKALPWILGGAALGLGVLWWRSRKPPAPPPGSDKKKSACELAKQAADAAGLPFSDAACESILGLGGKLVDAVFTNSAEDNAKEAAKRDELNRQLNGEIELPSVGMQGSALRFKNGCVPFHDAQGWDKCAAGTLSMWPTDTWGSSSPITPGAHGTGDTTRPAFRTAADERAFLDSGWEKLPANRRGAVVGDVYVDPHAVLTGSTDPANPDPTTLGGARRDGGWVGFVKGVRVQCPVGEAPALWDASGNPIRDQRDGVPPCAPGGVSSFTPSTDAPPPTVVGSSVSTSLACNGTQAPAGFTWDASSGGFWRRLAVGETPNAGPCSPNYIPLTRLGTGAASALAVTNGRLADMQ